MNVLNMQTNFWFPSKFEHWTFASNVAYSKNIYWKLKFLCSPCHFSNIQKQKFKEYPPYNDKFHKMVNAQYGGPFFKIIVFHKSPCSSVKYLNFCGTIG
jgi:hypothetical protein